MKLSKRLYHCLRDCFNLYSDFFSLHTIFSLPAVLNPSAESYKSPHQDRHGERRSSHRAGQAPTHTVLPAPVKFKLTSALQQGRIPSYNQCLLVVLSLSPPTWLCSVQYLPWEIHVSLHMPTYSQLPSFLWATLSVFKCRSCVANSSLLSWHPSTSLTLNWFQLSYM